ncbi:putative N-formylglutamate amidohydrolase [Pontibacter aydingkolensis]|uniref:N-formylglutamate amidohydrolase n=1 Tax=Pontibacter aydingkolensis TaxID=1911536 RepID=A0ABS7CYQ8_9BACT|nr:N-formylglutamate amidohydrolase [Pontibacter aydingkolensis]MBW7468993.1 N-formylglutamate amidohydrolase [Pontibacter aydingkolensis]
MLKLLLTCEHGGNDIPIAYQSLFQGNQDVLRSHAGYDIGALELYNELEPLADISFYSETSRLLVELNRSLHHKKLFSEYTQNLANSDKNFILKNYYYPYRDKVEQLVQDFVMAGRQVLHIAVHSFTPVLNGEERHADIGLLYDPKRKGEQQFCREWRQAITNQNPNLLVRNNYPYLGISDGFPTYLRKRFKEKEYLGIELEVNQKFPKGNAQDWNALKIVLKESLAIALRHKRPSEQQEQVA